MAPPRGAVKIGADDEGVVADRHRAAEVIKPVAVAGEEVRLLGPARAGAYKDVGRAGVAPPGGAVKESAHHDCIAADRRRGPEAVTGRAVAGDEVRLLIPARAVAHKDVGRAGVAPPGGAVKRPDDGSVATDPHGGAELVASRPIARDEVRLGEDQRIDQQRIGCAAVLHLEPHCVPGHAHPGRHAGADRIESGQLAVLQHALAVPREPHPLPVSARLGPQRPAHRQVQNQRIA